MLKQQCAICNSEIGLLEYKKVIDGRVICKNCATKSGVIIFNDVNDISVEMLKAWIDDPKERKEFLLERKAKLDAERVAEQNRRIAEENLRQEKARKDEHDRKLIEMRRFPKGRVHVLIEQVSFTEIGAVLSRGNALDNTLQVLQDRGCHIMNVTCYTSGEQYVQAVIVYREPGPMYENGNLFQLDENSVK